MGEGSSALNLGAGIRALEPALKLLPLSISSSAQDSLCYGHVSAVAH